MDSKDYGQIIGKNLKRLAYESGKTQADISRDLKISKTTLSSWMSGYRVPRMSKIDLLCHYFNCTREDIMEPQAAISVKDRWLAYHKALCAHYDAAPESIKEAVNKLLDLKEGE